MPTYTRHTDFLKDKQFIRWQLVPDEEVEAYWKNFIEQNPDLNPDLEQAVDYLKTTGLNNSTLTDAERLHLLNKIESTIERSVKTTKIRRIIQLSVGSCAAIALLIVGLNHFVFQEKKIHYSADKELIVGNLLNNKDIQLITEEDSLLFQNDVQVEFDKTGKAKIRQTNSEEKKVELAKSKQNTLIVPYGKRSTLTLSDGSKVWLNSGSALEFPSQFIDNNREIRLASGEMYIEVSPDRKKPFHVRTSDFDIKVYGTKFNVSAYANASPSVVLVEGSVGLLSNYGEEVNLLSNDQAIYLPDGTFNTRQVDVSHHISWKDGYLLFEETPMSEVLRQIEKNYNLSFNYEKDVSLKELTCTGTIILSENLDNVMTTIALLTSTKYIKEDNRIYITNNF